MFTAIVPTLQRSPVLADLLSVLTAAPGVAQIVVINNAESPLEVADHLVEQVEVIEPGRNLFVNPSWNLGVDLATQDRLLPCNDDLVFPGPLVDVLAAELERGVGIIGPSLTCLQVRPEDADPHFRRIRVRPYGFGSLMALDRANYHRIPDELRIWCGDDWLFTRQARPNLLLSGVPIRTRMGTTSTAPEFGPIKAADLAAYGRLKAGNPHARRYPIGYAVDRGRAIWRGRVSDVRARRRAS